MGLPVKIGDWDDCGCCGQETCQDVLMPPPASNQKDVHLDTSCICIFPYEADRDIPGCYPGGGIGSCGDRLENEGVIHYYVWGGNSCKVWDAGVWDYTHVTICLSCSQNLSKPGNPYEWALVIHIDTEGAIEPAWYAWGYSWYSLSTFGTDGAGQLTGTGSVSIRNSITNNYICSATATFNGPDCKK